MNSLIALTLGYFGRFYRRYTSAAFLSFALFSSLGVSQFALATAIANQNSLPTTDFCSFDSELDIANHSDKDIVQQLVKENCPTAFLENTANWNAFKKLQKTCESSFDTLLKTKRILCKNVGIIKQEILAMPIGAKYKFNKHRKGNDVSQYKKFRKSKVQQIVDLTALIYELEIFYDLIEMRKIVRDEHFNGSKVPFFESIARTKQFIAHPTGNTGIYFLQGFEVLQSHMNSDLDKVYKHLEQWKRPMQSTSTAYRAILKTLIDQKISSDELIRRSISLHSGAVQSAPIDGEASDKFAESARNEILSAGIEKAVEDEELKVVVNSVTALAVGGTERLMELFSSMGTKVAIGEATPIIASGPFAFITSVIQLSAIPTETNGGERENEDYAGACASAKIDYLGAPIIDGGALKGLSRCSTCSR